MRKTFIFLSSYIPLYILLIGKNIITRIEKIDEYNLITYDYKSIIWFNNIDDYIIVFFLVLSLFLLFWLKKFVRPVTNGNKYIIKNYENETDKYFFGYISIYFLPCIGLSIDSISDIFILFAIMIIVGYVYISNDLLYINPTLSLLGYKIFSVQLLSILNNIDSNIEERYILIHKKQQDKIRVGKMICVSNAKKYCLLQED